MSVEDQLERIANALESRDGKPVCGHEESAGHLVDARWQRIALDTERAYTAEHARVVELEAEVERQKGVVADIRDLNTRVITERMEAHAQANTLRGEVEQLRRERGVLDDELLGERDALKAKIERLLELGDEWAAHAGMFDASMDTELHKAADDAYVDAAQKLRAVLEFSGGAE